jgi:hypothetical protein
MPRPDLPLQPLPQPSRRAHPRSPPPLPPAGSTGAIIRPANKPSRHATSARFTSGNASQRGTPPSGAANGGAPLHQLTLRLTSLTAAGPLLPQPQDIRHRGQQAINTDEGGMPRFAYVCSLACSLRRASGCPSTT